MRKPGPRATNRYSAHFKATAVRLSQLPGVRGNDVAVSLSIHRTMLSRWRKQAREGLSVTKTVEIDKDVAAELKELRKLKKDLIREVHTAPYKAVIASKLIETAKAHGVLAVAEGVEKAGELDWLRSHGTDQVQGFYFSKPGSPPPHPDPVPL